MRIENKYLRNRHFRLKHWKRVRAKSHPFETYCPWACGFHRDDVEEQVRRHFEFITKEARKIENGSHHAQWLVGCSSDFRRILNKQRKAKERRIMARIRNGEYDLDMPKFRRDAAYDYW